MKKVSQTDGRTDRRTDGRKEVFLKLLGHSLKNTHKRLAALVGILY